MSFKRDRLLRRIPLDRVLMALVVSMVAIPAAADTRHGEGEHVVGLRISQTDVVESEVFVDISVFYTLNATETTARLGTAVRDAIDWGDGIRVRPLWGLPLVSTSTVVNGTPVRAYRGSFSHAYGSVGNYTVTASSGCCPPANGVVTGTIGQSGFTTVVAPANRSHSFYTYVTFVANTLGVDITVPPLFADGFESGDVSGWSETTPRPPFR